MNFTSPHVIPYQGSKRKLANQILSFVKFSPKNLFEPFAGSAAITLMAASRNLAGHYVIGDKFEPLALLWEMIVNDPKKLISEYTTIWNNQLSDPSNYYNFIREEFNKNKMPAHLLYLIARCVKNSIRFNGQGEFNQSPDHRRLGTKPDKIAHEILRASQILKDKVTIKSDDYRKLLAKSTSDDIVYLDPPWQGTSGNRDPRYAFQLDLEELVNELSILNKRNISYLLSFDGSCGNHHYGEKLPESLNLLKIELEAGRSSQATLLGRNEKTTESLYLSPAIVKKSQFNRLPTHKAHSSKTLQLSFF